MVENDVKVDLSDPLKGVDLIGEHPGVEQVEVRVDHHQKNRLRISDESPDDVGELVLPSADFAEAGLNLLLSERRILFQDVGGGKYATQTPNVVDSIRANGAKRRRRLLDRQANELLDKATPKSQAKVVPKRLDDLLRLVDRRVQRQRRL